MYKFVDKSYIQKVLEFIAKHGNLELMKIMYNASKFDIRSNNGKIFRLACENGHFELAKWIYSLDSSMKILGNHSDTFYNVCVNGHLEIAKWLFDLEYTETKFPDLRIDENPIGLIFTNVCAFNKINIAKWLYSLKNNIIHTENDYPFRIACQNGHLEMAKWLYSLINVNGQKNEINIGNIFIDICYNGNFEMIKWFYSIYPDIKLNKEQVYHIKEKFNEIFAIVDKLK